MLKQRPRFLEVFVLEPTYLVVFWLGESLFGQQKYTFSEFVV